MLQYLMLKHVKNTYIMMHFAYLFKTSGDFLIPPCMPVKINKVIHLYFYMFCWCISWLLRNSGPLVTVCTSLTLRNGQQTSMSGNVFGSTITLQCNQGYYTNGSSSLTCGPEAQWIPNTLCLIHGRIKDIGHLWFHNLYVLKIQNRWIWWI